MINPNLNNLRALMALYKLENKDMAAIINKSNNTFSSKLNGHIDFTLPESKAIADTFKRTIDEVFYCPEGHELRRNSVTK